MRRKLVKATIIALVSVVILFAFFHQNCKDVNIAANSFGMRLYQILTSKTDENCCECDNVESADMDLSNSYVLDWHGMLSNHSLQPDIDQRIDSFDPQKMPKFPFLENYKNPCWYEMLPDDYKKASYDRVGLWYDDRIEIYRERMMDFFDERLQQGQKWRLRCLPLIQIIGVEKSGTSELFRRLRDHPEIVSGANKELQFWGSCALSSNLTFNRYLSFLDEAAETIRTWYVKKELNGREVEYHPLMALEASPRTWISSGGNIPNNENQARQSVDYLSAYQIKNIAPGFDIKIVMVVRNPTERLFSGYQHFGERVHPETSLSPKDFHRRVVEQIEEFNECLEVESLDSCTYKSMNDRLYSVRLQRGIYYPAVKHWIKIFPDMKVIRTEDMRGKVGKKLMNELFEYIGVKPLTYLDTNTKANKGSGKMEMLSKTRTLLDDFYKPYNQMLADFLHDERFLFEE